ncbi:putative membrane protein YgcG [Actinomadura coerulea]|uniref:Putative membrane protein YgcG n=1 Tax=Actinomadura coerulea TaxID=46159 RepID=A0A7X0L023_9ACTN|nr:hypothetical protein [Actinomadura coerulea]MBB6397035.1 putative membrane protein YgcG [Actinomadura coerulea]GGP96161.1 hypothetical protein GCM10010187_09780 [Actinomadura coerulea]
MICRATVKPIFVGLGTAAILAAGGASAVADVTPSPSGSDPASPSTGKLTVDVASTAARLDPGDSLDITTTVTAVGGDVANIKVTNITATLKGTAVTGDCGAPFETAGCTVGDLADGKSGAPVRSHVTVPKEGPKETAVYTITVTVDATDLAPVAGTTTFKYVVPVKPPPTKTPTPTPSKTPTKSPSRKPTKPSPTPSHSSSSGTSNRGSGGSGGSSGNGSGNGTGTSGSVQTSPNSSFEPQNPQVALPSLQAPSPSVAPSPSPGMEAPQSRLQGNKAPVAQDLTFERMASTQIAWLAALMVAFSLLLTQLRLGRRRVPAGAPRRPRGTHRRPRGGMFGR